MAGVSAGYVYYKSKWYWPWQMNTEQALHFSIGFAWFVGGIISALAIRKFLPRIAIYALPLAMLYGGVRFFQPHQHGTSGGDGYLIIFHSILGFFLAASGICVFLTFKYRGKWKWLPVISLVIGTISGCVLMAYRDPPAIHSNCAGESRTVEIDVSKQDQPDRYVHLCDNLKFMSTIERSTAPIFGDHHHHAQYAGFQTKIIDKNTSEVFPAKLAGRFDIHDHISGKKIVTLRVDTHPTDPSWVLHKY